GVERTREREALADARAEAPLAGGAADEGADALIARTALWCGALELLPQGLASLAILPLQMRMVYRLGLRHGYELDRGHVRDLLAAAGVGLTGQVLEGFARRLIGNLAGRLGGGLLRGLAGGATGAAFSYATTLALGRTAERYYAGGRKLSGAELREVFTGLVDGARDEARRREDEMRSFARDLAPARLLDLVR
ncbi:MAG TPA: GTPase, partial [Planctomycetota bacterium]|nr:GTPase [Planctomycetota bacterium]